MYNPLDIPHGIYRAGTEYQSKGRYYDSNLVRFTGGTIRPIGGWRQKSAAALEGAPRAILTWKDNSSTTWAAIGTHDHLYAMGRSGALYDITPSGLIPGRADALAAGGFGSGGYGGGGYGVPTPDDTLIQDTTVWSLDTFGEHLVGANADDGVLYEWTLDTGAIASAVSGAPTARACFTSEEGMLMALGADGNPRRVKWSDQRDNTEWTPSATNQAGDFDLQTGGRLMCGKRIRGGALLFTDLDVHLCTYIGGQLVYGFSKIAEGCGVVSQNCVAVLDSQAIWMGRSGFWSYNGFAAPLACDVQDYVFGDLNYQQVSKVTAWVNSSFGEVWFHYPSGGSTENDRYVVWNYRENLWTIGTLSRLAGADRGAFLYPLLSAADGNIKEHEVGLAYDGLTPFLESGPLEAGRGDAVSYIDQLIPDEKTAGDVNAMFFSKLYPNGAETSFGPYALASPTWPRFCARQFKVRYAGAVLADWRIGALRVNLSPGGAR